MLFLESGDNQRARASFEEAVGCDQVFQKTYWTLAGLLQSLNLPEEAEAYLRKAVEKHPEEPDAYLHLAANLTQQSKHQEAIDVARAALGRCDKYFGVWLEQAEHLNECGRKEVAMEALDRAFGDLRGRSRDTTLAKRFWNRLLPWDLSFLYQTDFAYFQIQTISWLALQFSWCKRWLLRIAYSHRNRE